MFCFRLKTPRYKAVKPDGPMQRLKISKNVGVSLDRILFVFFFTYFITLMFVIML